MHTTTAIGVITDKGAELRRTQNGDPVLGFSLQVSNGKNKAGEWYPSTYFDCALWGSRGEALGKHLTAGKALCVTGKVKAREHNGKAYMDITVDRLDFLPKDRSDNTPTTGGGYQQFSSGGGYGGSLPDDDEIPF